MYPYGSLPENVVAFCDRLRRVHDFNVGPGEVRDALRALDVAPLPRIQGVRDCWRPILCSRREDVVVFDRAFEQFFFPGPAGAPQASLAKPGRRPSDGSKKAAEGRSSTRFGETTREGREEAEGDAVAATFSRQEVDGEDTDDAATSRRLGRWSPMEAESAPPVLAPVDAEWRAGARALVRRIQAGRARRWRSAPRGQRFDLRRTLRRSLQTGGEPIVPRWLARPLHHPRFVVLIDGSRSMHGSERAALDLAMALAAESRRVAVFLFSTDIADVTDVVTRAARGRANGLAGLQHAWGGGTSIGGCLRTFLREHAERRLTRDTVVVIVSDGLDVGALHVLQEAMREIHRRAAGVVWLNPLLETTGYEPTAGGMRVARPYVTTFSSVGNAADLGRLARTVRLRA